MRIISSVFFNVFYSLFIFLFLFLSATYAQTNVIERYGQLSVDGNKIVDKNNEPVALHGMSLFWSQWMPQYYNYDCVQWLRDDWKCTVVRAALGVNGTTDGYLVSPEVEKARIKSVVDAAIDLGIYVIVDWHDHNAQDHQEEAVGFFAEIAEQYGEYPNIIYEIFNEPLNNVSWSNVIKPYAETVIDTIRYFDPDNLVIVGTPTWSQDVDVAANDPLDYNNIAYALHFYAATHKQYLRNKAATALNRGIALFVSEWGTCEASGTGPIDYDEVEAWTNFMEQNKLSWCNWSIADKDETSAALKSGAGGTGNWPDSLISVSGLLIREKIRNYYSTIPVELLSFSANFVNDYIRLDWSTATEINNSGFEVLRKDNNSEWKTIGFVEGKGTVTEIQNYSFIDKNFSGGNYIYQLKQIDFDGSFALSDEVEVNFNLQDFQLKQNFPNPFNPKTTIGFILNDKGSVTLNIFDLNGNKIKTLLDTYKAKGKYEVTWDGTSDSGIKVSSGIYFFNLNFNGNKKIIKGILLK